MGLAVFSSCPVRGGSVSYAVTSRESGHVIAWGSERLVGGAAPGDGRLVRLDVRCVRALPRADRRRANLSRSARPDQRARRARDGAARRRDRVLPGGRRPSGGRLPRLRRDSRRVVRQGIDFAFQSAAS